MKKKRVDLVVTDACQLLTLKGRKGMRLREEMRELGLIDNGAIAVAGKNILDVGRAKDIEKRYEGKRKILATEKVVMPGFVDCHTHLIFAGSREKELVHKLQGRSYLEILKEGGGILHTVRETRKASLDELVRLGSQRLDRMMLNGTTTVEAKTGYGLNLKDEMKCLKAIKLLQKKHQVSIVPTFLGAHAIPPDYENAERYTDAIINHMLPKVCALAEFCDVFCETGVFSVAQSRRILVEAKRLGMGLKLHADELSQLRGAELSAEIGARSADHLLHASEEGLRKMAEKGVCAVLLPAVPMSMLSTRYADARKMIELGIPVALGTDFNPNCWVESMQLIISIACYQMRMLPEEAIVASTINAAHAINRGDMVGSLEAGKMSDIIILDVPNYMQIPYRIGSNSVATVIKHGRVATTRG